MKTPFPYDPYYTGIAVAYRNGRMIADGVLPRVPVDTEKFSFRIYEKADKFTVPNTFVGRKGQVKEIEFGGKEDTAQTEDYGLEDPIPFADIFNAQNSPNPRDPVAQAVENLADLIELDREQRVAGLVFAAGSYDAGFTDDLAAAWSDFTTGDPVKDILEAADAMIFKPNRLVLGRTTYTTIRRHPKVVAAAIPLGGNAIVGGVVMEDALARVFEVDQVLVGESWINTAKRGQNAALNRVWGPHAALLMIDNAAGPQNERITFGFTAQWETRIAGAQMEDPKIGLRGGVRVRTGESVKELIIAKDLGYFFENAVSAVGS